MSSDLSESEESVSTSGEQGDERRVRFHEFAIEQPFFSTALIEDDPYPEQVRTKLTDDHFMYHPKKPTRARTRTLRRGLILRCVWNYINGYDHAARLLPSGESLPELEYNHVPFRKIYADLLERLSTAAAQLPGLGASPSLQRLARLKARELRQVLQRYVLVRFEELDRRGLPKGNRCSSVHDFKQTELIWDMYYLWLERAKKAEAETGKLIDLQEDADLEIEDEEDEDVQTRISAIREVSDLSNNMKYHIIQRFLLLRAIRKGSLQAAARHRREYRLLGHHNLLLLQPPPPGPFFTCPRCSRPLDSTVAGCAECCYAPETEGDGPGSTICHFEACLSNAFCGMIHKHCFECHWSPRNISCRQCRRIFAGCHVACTVCDWAADAEGSEETCPSCEGDVTFLFGCDPCAYALYETTDAQEHGKDCVDCDEKAIFNGRVLCVVEEQEEEEDDHHDHDHDHDRDHDEADDTDTNQVSNPDNSDTDASNNKPSDGDLAVVKAEHENDAEGGEQDPDQGSEADNVDSDSSDEGSSDNSSSDSNGADKAILQELRQMPTPETLFHEHPPQQETSQRMDLVDNDVVMEDVAIEDHSESDGIFSSSPANEESVEEPHSQGSECTLSAAELGPSTHEEPPAAELHISQPGPVRRCSRCSWKLPSGHKPCIFHHWGPKSNPSTLISSSNQTNGSDFNSPQEKRCSCSSPSPTQPCIELAPPRGKGSRSSSAASPVSPRFLLWASSPPHTFTPEEVTDIIASWKARNRQRHAASIDAANTRLERVSQGSPLKRKRSSSSSPPSDTSSPKRSRINEVDEVDEAEKPVERTADQCPSGPSSPSPSTPSTTSSPFTSPPPSLSPLERRYHTLQREIAHLEDCAISPISLVPRHITSRIEQLKPELAEVEADLASTWPLGWAPTFQSQNAESLVEDTGTPLSKPDVQNRDPTSTALPVPVPLPRDHTGYILGTDIYIPASAHKSPGRAAPPVKSSPKRKHSEPAEGSRCRKRSRICSAERVGLQCKCDAGEIVEDGLVGGWGRCREKEKGGGWAQGESKGR